jgi:hypothetical protein
MLRFLAGDGLWKELRAISFGRRYPVQVAVPFLGAGGGKLLRLRRGDVLVTALTLANAQNGSVCPRRDSPVAETGCAGLSGSVFEKCLTPPTLSETRFFAN